MYGLISLGAIMAVYIATFKDDFSKENIEKVIPFIALVCITFIGLGILGSVVSK